MADIVLTDGGMGQEILQRWGREPQTLWSASVMMEAPEVVRDTHADFIRAGARVVIVNAYSVTRPRLRSSGIEDRFEALQRTACRLAVEAREQAGRSGVLVAGTLPPLRASYRPEEAGDPDEMRADYAEIAAIQGESCDLLIAETLPTFSEVRAAGEAMAGSGRPFWIGVTVDDADGSRLRSGEPVAEAARLSAGLGAAGVVANCSLPEAVSQAMPGLAEGGIPFGGYANAFVEIPDVFRPFTTVKVLNRRDDMGPVAYATAALGWVDAGATIVGGCCEIGPEHIRVLGETLAAAGHTIVTPEGALLRPADGERTGPSATA